MFHINAESSAQQSPGSRRRRGAAVMIGSLLSALVLAGSAPAEHRELDLLSTGPGGGNLEIDASFEGASTDGTRVFIETDESLVSADTDPWDDIYERAGGQTTLVTPGTDAEHVTFRRASDDGARVFFDTAEPLVSDDTDASNDLYERAGGQTTLVSTGPDGGNGDFWVFFSGASADGTRVYFETQERLVSTDTDDRTDVYERAGGQTVLVSTGPDGGNGDIDAGLVGDSSDGTRILFHTDESLVSADTDTMQDVYERAGGQTTLISTGPDGGNGDFVAFHANHSDDATRVFFQTEESLVSADSDTQLDIYERANGQTTLISTGEGDFWTEYEGESDDGTAVFFETNAPLASTDTDEMQDVYVRAGGQTTLLSTGPDGGNGEFEAYFRDDSTDGARVIFETDESLVSADTDTARDLYVRAGGQTTLVSTGPAGGNADTDVEFEDASADAGRVFFTTEESLVSADTDTRLDVYEHANGQTTLLSTGPNGGNADFNALFRGTSEDGSHVFFETQESLLSGDTDTVNDIYGKRIAAPDTAPPTAPGPGADPTPGPSGSNMLPGACANAKSGTARVDRLLGGDFGDRLRGRAGDDVLIGRGGDDCLRGGRGDDWLGGSLGNDRLAGEDGDDTLKGGRGRDVLDGGRGNDRIYSLDGRRDTVRCGKGADDRVRVDRRDQVIGCEQVTRVGG
jgi:hypothetical protein